VDATVINHPRDDWRPGPELLAAYFDGELAGRTDLVLLKQRVQDWLRRHPDAMAELADYRQLDRLWQETAPADPGEDAWQQLQGRIAPAPRMPAARPRRSSAGYWAAVLLATAAGIVLAVWLGLAHEGPQQIARPPAFQPQPLVDAPEIFPVATADEIAILHVDGADTQTLVVGELPVQGALELAGPGEVALTSVQPDRRDNMMPLVHIGGAQHPLIWAPVEQERR
jgi:hypothetical protein